MTAAGGSLTDVRGIRVGHFTDTRRPTGCTAILFDTAVAAGVDYNGSAPGESMVVMLQPVSPVEKIHALFLTGGGIFALHAHSGVLRYLEEHKVGFDWGTPDLRIPIVVSAVIDDLAVGDPRIRPDAEAAYKACAAATTSPVPEGNVGAGAGATVGKMHRGRGLSGMKGGIGTASLTAGELVIGALAVVNAAGDILDWRKGTIVAGARRPDGTLADSVEVMRASLTEKPRGAPLEDNALRSTDAGGGGDQCDADQDRAHQAGDDGQLRRRPGHTALSHDRRRRSVVRDLHRRREPHRRALDDAGVAGRRRGRRSDRARRARGAERRRVAWIASEVSFRRKGGSHT